MKSTVKVYSLQMRYPFGISRGTSTEIQTVLYQLGEAGQGEGSPVRYKNQQPEDVVAALEKLSDLVTEENLPDIDGLDAEARKMGAPSAAVAAFNIALWDALGRRESKPIYDLAGAPKPELETTYTISLADNDTMEERAREASHLPLLKVKLGRDEIQDWEAIQRIHRAAPGAKLRVDANAGWGLGAALSIIPKLESIGVEYVEQPLAIGNYDDLKVLHDQSPLPIFVDEDAQTLASLEALRGKCAGINIKLMKCGGITEALKMIKFARQEGWKVMIGCMVESRAALGAAAHICGLCDYVDLDAHMLTVNDPYPPGSQETFTADLPFVDGPGIGLPFLKE